MVNANGHGVLHKAAQRGQSDIGEWFVSECICIEGLLDQSAKPDDILYLIGPDTEGYTPSDLAGMEGHQDFAERLASIEIEICHRLGDTPSFKVPEGYSITSMPGNSWEKYGGVRRMVSSLSKR
jgi:ankyrin repeat protein